MDYFLLLAAHSQAISLNAPSQFWTFIKKYAHFYFFINMLGQMFIILNSTYFMLILIKIYLYNMLLKYIGLTKSNMYRKKCILIHLESF